MNALDLDGQTAADDHTIYHLADGILLVIGRHVSRVVDLRSHSDTRLDMRYVDVFERLGRGACLPEHSGLLARLLAANVIAPGPARSDPYIRQRLQQLDEYYLAFYRPKLSARLLDAYRLGLEVHARRKRFFQRVGQCPVLPETALRRALLVGDAEQVGVLDILCLGDDDLVSVVLRALGHRVTVYDVDHHLLDFIRVSCDVHSLVVDAEALDARDPVPKEKRERFDVVMTDPMSNQDCFELFLSRALSMLKPGGRLYTACFPPARALFDDVIAKMGLDVAACFAGFNRYYSDRFRLHEYASDWIELRAGCNASPTVASADFRVPLNLYREDFYRRLPIVVGDFQAIDEVEFGRPVYLNFVLDALSHACELDLGERRFYAGESWALVLAFGEKSRLMIHIDRAKKRLAVELFPFTPEVENELRSALMSVFKPRPSQVEVKTTNAIWSVTLG